MSAENATIKALQDADARVAAATRAATIAIEGLLEVAEAVAKRGETTDAQALLAVTRIARTSARSAQTALRGGA